MNHKSLEDRIADQYIKMLAKDQKNLTFSNIVDKAKVSLEKANIIFPFDDELIKIKLMKIFLKNIDQGALTVFCDEIKDENITFYEKLLEGIFIRFEELFKHKKAIKKLSYNLNMKILNFNILFFDNHIFMLKLLKLSGDNDSFIKLSIKSVLLNSIFFRCMIIFLNEDKMNINSLMRKVDDDLKKLFEINILFKNI